LWVLGFFLNPILPRIAWILLKLLDLYDFLKSEQIGSNQIARDKALIYWKIMLLRPSAWPKSEADGSYNRGMARGWESKSVEEQQAQANTPAPKGKAPLSPEQTALNRRREGLQLSRKRVLQQIEASRNPQHRRMLEQALTELDARLARLG
jgi:hypothetical protein